ncbi:hypothetical protein PEDI_54860 [Persicobacter diffluens]|uniref:Uncharacterized protein n=1 Tax=Persicobacter diffluens TaxID=981 RepID=A0AAN4W3A3_9BACT|nr:hypothetical protein PEDI_54860 [Persicobacter diffluens]
MSHYPFQKSKKSEHGLSIHKKNDNYRKNPIHISQLGRFIPYTLQFM